MGFLFKNKKAPTIVSVPTASSLERSLPLFAPKREDFYQIHREEFKGVFLDDSTRISFLIPYSDWCEFEKSDLYQDLEDYLQGLQKRDSLNESVNIQG